MAPCLCPTDTLSHRAGLQGGRQRTSIQGPAATEPLRLLLNTHTHTHTHTHTQKTQRQLAHTHTHFRHTIPYTHSHSDAQTRTDGPPRSARLTPEKAKPQLPEKVLTTNKDNRNLGFRDPEPHRVCVYVCVQRCVCVCVCKKRKRKGRIQCGVERELYTFFIFRLFFFSIIVTCDTLYRAHFCRRRQVCVTLGVREWWCSGGPERRSHGSLIPPTLKVKASTPRSRGGEVETDRWSR